MPAFFDTHAHLDQSDFDGDREAVVQRAREAGVASILSVATTAESSLATVRLAAQFEGVYAAVGIHPNSAAQAAPGDWDRVVGLIHEPRVAALGETGLDRHWDFTPFEVQQEFFDRHLRLSQDTGLPVVIHSRECDADILAMLHDARRRGPLSGILHSFCGSAETAAEGLALGLYISFAGMVTYKKNDALRAVARTIPGDRLLIETDSPYLTPEPIRKIRRNEPAHVVHTAACLAAARSVTVEEFAAQTTANAQRLFRIA
jgi:TatD DNase family protein